VTPAVEIKGLRKTYAGGVEALRGIDLVVARGEFFGLLGPNGAGKTTTIGITTGLVRPSGGQVRVLGADVVTQYRDARRKIGLAAQELNFDWFFPIEELMILQAGYYGVPRKVAQERAVRLLDAFGLLKKRQVKPRELSGGMKRRFQIARSLIHDPEILILDEPTAGVDVELRRFLWKYLTRLNRGGKTIILTTHYIEEAEKLCERVAIIDEGKIVTDGTPQALMAGLKGDGMRIVLEGWNDKVAQAINGYDFKFDDGRLKIQIAQPEMRLPQIVNQLTAAGATVHDVAIRHTTLEDVFTRLTGHGIDE